MNAPVEFQVPHSQSAEQSVLGGLLVDNNAIDRLGELAESAFFSESHRLIYRAIRNQAAAGKAWDVITVAEMLEKQGKLQQCGDLGYIGSLAMNVPSSANIMHYADIIREHATRRAIMAAAAELSEMASGKQDIDAAMDKVQSRLLAITESVKADEPRSIGSIVVEHLDTIEKRLCNDRKAITTGLKDLDAILNGGWHRGQVIVLAARPSMGKTALSLHNAIEAARAGYGVLYLSMEMVAEELADRAIASYGRVSLGNILSAKMDEDEWGGVARATGQMQDLPLHVVDRAGLTFYQVASYARRHKRKCGLDLLVVDYLQLMAGADGAEKKRHAEIEEITRNLKTLAKEIGVAVILLSQLSRQTEQIRRPKLSHLRDSGSIEQDADVVLFIHREEVDAPETLWKNYADIHIAKNRQGALGRIGATYIGHQVRFENFAGQLPDWDKPAEAVKRGFK